MMTLSDLAGRIEIDIKTRKRYKGPPILVAAAQPDREVVVVEEGGAKRRTGPTATVQLDRAAIEGNLDEYGGSVMAVAELVAGDSPIYELLLPEDTDEAKLTIGRDEHNDIVLTDPGVSGSHAVLCHRFGRWTLEDLESRNGTYVNQSALVPGKEKTLVNCDCVRFGERVYYFLAGQYLLHFFTHWIGQRIS